VLIRSRCHPQTLVYCLLLRHWLNTCTIRKDTILLSTRFFIMHVAFRRCNTTAISGWSAPRAPLIVCKQKFCPAQSVPCLSSHHHYFTVMRRSQNLNIWFENLGPIFQTLGSVVTATGNSSVSLGEIQHIPTCLQRKPFNLQSRLLVPR
jgi:hypothetical protein